MRANIVTVFLLFFASLVSAQTTKLSQGGKPAISMDRYEGTSVVTDLGYNIKVNKESSMKREWFVLRDENAPAFIVDQAGISVIYKSVERSSLGQYQYKMANYRIRAREPITAFEVRVHVLDFFGRLLKTLSATEIADFPPDNRIFDGTWRIWSENEASEVFASIAYVAQVRTASGRVYEADRAAVFDQVRKVAKKITEADLEPKREPPPK